MFRSGFNHLLKEYEPGEKLFPNYSTVYRTLSPLLRDWRFVSSMECKANLDNKSGSRRSLQSLQGVAPIASHFKVILTSPWYLMDLACHEEQNVLKRAAIEPVSKSARALFSNIWKACSWFEIDISFLT